ncbi:MAG: hypothetical protein KF678_07100 [Phycisphaeraceae bacterium]|nr:hypothetical protein [Phycisphaeraceae bacterium]
MARRTLHLDELVARRDAPASLPVGTPEWITPDLVLLTRKVWEPRYGKPLSVEEAITIILTTGRLFELLKRE